MGIKDWMDSEKIKDLFGKGEKARKKEELREKVKEAVQDGKLTNSDLMEIRSLQQELDVDDVASDRTQLRREIYNEAVDAVRQKSGGMTATGMHELAKIQKFLALRDDQVEKTRFQVTRLRTLTEIRKGNLPVVPDSSVALRDVTLEEGETAHYTMAVDILDQPSTRQNDGVPLVPGQDYPEGAAAPYGLPDGGAKEMGEATLLITNRRLVLKTRGRLAAIKLGRESKLSIYADGLRLERAVGNTLLRFRSRSDETAEIVGALLSRVMREA